MVGKEKRFEKFVEKFRFPFHRFFPSFFILQTFFPLRLLHLSVDPTSLEARYAWKWRAASVTLLKKEDKSSLLIDITTDFIFLSC